MAPITASVEVACPPETVFTYVTDPSRFGEWQENVTGGHIPAIALTAYARREDRQRALGAGYDLHLAKPVEPNDLARTVANLLEQRQG